MAQSALFLRNLWYMAMPGPRLKPGKMVAKRLLGEALLFGRGKDAKPFALRNLCPHRGVPLSYGRFDGTEIECCYHGWRFSTHGTCTAIPSLVAGQHFDMSRIKVPGYPCREVQGNVWIFMGDGGEESQLPDIPHVPEMGVCCYQAVQSSYFPCDIDHAVVGLMDPAHGPFVHRAWWWRSKRSMHEKVKHFAPAPLGFTMLRHEPSSNSAAYKILGGGVSTEITFHLPGVRIEHIKAGRYVVCGLTTVTPLTEHETEVHQFFYWTLPWLGLIKPFLKLFMRAFLGQDRDVIIKQQEGLAGNARLMLIHDADTQARWYFQLKQEFVQAQDDKRPFVNPVPTTELRWCS